MLSPTLPTRPWGNFEPLESAGGGYFFAGTTLVAARRAAPIGMVKIVLWAPPACLSAFFDGGDALEGSMHKPRPPWGGIGVLQLGGVI
jgi:hypothetical protein